MSVDIGANGSLLASSTGIVPTRFFDRRFIACQDELDIELVGYNAHERRGWLGEVEVEVQDKNEPVHHFIAIYNQGKLFGHQTIFKL